MKKVSKYIFAMFMCGIMTVACSSGDNNNPNSSEDNGTTPSGQVPANTDSGKNNNSMPDNVNHQSTGSDTTGDNTGDNSGDNTGDESDSTGDNTGSGDTGSSIPQWTLVFEDNFEGSDSIPDPDKWILAEKGDDTWNRHMSGSYGQAYQKDGYLYLFGMLHEGEYLTGGIETRGKFDFTYGQVKCRARFLRQPQGNHTGIWMMPEPPAEKWPMSGEIDIMEHLDDQNIIYETCHNWWANELGHEDDPEYHSTAEIDKDEFNVYGIVWDEDAISFTVNGKVNFTYPRKNFEGENADYQWPYYKPFYLILSQSLGGKGTWEGVIDNDELPAIFQIDWIKVWQKEK